jgi:hypothetical protein
MANITDPVSIKLTPIRTLVINIEETDASKPAVRVRLHTYLSHLDETKIFGYLINLERLGEVIDALTACEQAAIDLGLLVPVVDGQVS